LSLFTPKQESIINAQAVKSEQLIEPKISVNSKSIKNDLNVMSAKVIEYFQNSEAILITDEIELLNYVDKVIEVGYCGIDTETTGLDRRRDSIVGISLYYPGGKECYIPCKHMLPIFNEPRKNQMTYEQIAPYLNKLVDSKVKLIFANADFDLAMIYNSIGVDLIPAFHYDVILAWRCLKENEKRNGLKELYHKYVLKGEGDAGRFSDFFTPSLFPFCEPEVAKLYAANDAKITYELFMWQLPYITKDNPKCIKNNLQQIADLIWNIEFPLVAVCQEFHRLGIYIDKFVSTQLNRRYEPIYAEELAKLQYMVGELSSNPKYMTKSKKPWYNPSDFNPDSPKHVSYLVYDMLKLDAGKTRSTDKEILNAFKLPITNQILRCRSLNTLINTFVNKLPKEVWKDGRIHCQFNSVGASTGRMSCIGEGMMISMPGGDVPIQDVKSGSYVYTYTSDNKLTLAKVKTSWMTGIRDCVKLKWVSKYNPKSTSGELICTPDHFIKTTIGWVMAKDLTPQHRILHVHRADCKNSVRLSAYNGQGDEEEHAWIKREYLKPDNLSMNVHHEDGDRLDNDPTNLVLCTPGVHTNLHLSDGLPRNKHHIGRCGYSRDELIKMCEDVNWELWKVPHDWGTIIGWLQNYRVNYIQEYTASYSKRNHIKNRHGTYHKLARLQFNKTHVVYALELCEGNLALGGSYFGVSADKFKSACDKYELLDNHKVISIEYLEEPLNVYDLEIEGTHNFIASELCVHNSQSPNMQNIPSRNKDIRLMFRASPGYVLLSGDFSAQEPRLTAYCSNDEKMIQAFKDGKDIYGSIGAIAFGVPYEEAIEHMPDGSINSEGKNRRDSIKTVLLGATYGRSVQTIAEQLYGEDKSLTNEEMLAKGQAVFDAVMFACPALRSFMLNAQNHARKFGYVQTILGRRRHIPEMQLPEFEFRAMSGYINPDIDPMDIDTLSNINEIPDRVIESLREEFSGLRYFGQIVKRTKELSETEKIRVINNRKRITEASRRCVNSIIQGSAADQLKLAMLEVFNNQEWKDIRARLLIPVHDELIAEVPIENYERGVELLSGLMLKASEFLPFPSKCDVTISYRWYGQDFPCPYPKPNSLNNLTSEEILWVQYCLFEIGYDVKLDGIWDEECINHVNNYIMQHRISTGNFIEHIWNNVHLGTTNK